MKMTKKDKIYSFGFALAATVLTAVLFLSDPYTVYPTNVPQKTVLGHMLTDEPAIFLTESSSYAAPYVSRSTHVWTAVFLPLLCSAPFLLTFASEMKGNYRLKITRIGSLSGYWNRVFFKSGLSGAGCVTAGYLLFSAAVFAYFPHMSDYPAEPRSSDVISMSAVRYPLEGTLNRLFGSTESELLYWLPFAVNVFAYSFLVAIFCLLIYLLLANRYKAIGMPMIVFYLAEQFSSRRAAAALSSKWRVMSPRSLLINAEYVFSDFGAGGFSYLIFFALCALLIYFAGRKLFEKRVMN